MLFRSNSVRHEFPLQATCFRQVLPLVRGFPTLRVLRLIRLRSSMRQAFPFTVLFCLPRVRFPVQRLDSGLAPFPGFPFRALVSVCLTPALPTIEEPMWPPKFFDVSVPACHSLRTPADLHILAIFRMFRIGFGDVKTLAICNKLISKLYQLSGHAVAPTAYRILCVRFTCLVRLTLSASATGATLDTGGWLALTRLGLPPSKIRQAFLGAVTLRCNRQ